MPPKISVIIATHNRPHLLPDAVESARRAGTNVEVIVVDDASTDDTASVCRNLPGINYVRVERNQGVAGARNVGILASGAEFITFLDDDDRRLPGSLDRQLQALTAAPEAGLVYGQMIIVDQEYQPTGVVLPEPCPSGDLFWELLRGNFIPCLSVVLRKECLLKVGLLNSHRPGIDDWDLWVRIAEVYPIVAVEEPVGLWRRSAPFSAQGSSGTAGIYSQMAQHQRQLLRLPRALAAGKHDLQTARRSLLNMIFDALIEATAVALTHAATGHAFANVMTAVRLNPWRTARPWTLLLFANALRQNVFRQKTRNETVIHGTRGGAYGDFEAGAHS